jgi:hypothetical protein
LRAGSDQACADDGTVPKDKSDLERTADLVDVHVVDMLAQVQALLRSVSEVQRNVLRVRGVPASVTHSQREHAADALQKVLMRMVEECDAMREAIQEARASAATLNRVVHSESRHVTRRP